MHEKGTHDCLGVMLILALSGYRSLALLLLILWTFGSGEAFVENIYWCKTAR